MPEQHSFCYKRSRLVNQINFLEEATGRIYRGKGLEFCHLDFQEALNSVTHMRLGQKVEPRGMDSGVNN